MLLAIIFFKVYTDTEKGRILWNKMRLKIPILAVLVAVSVPIFTSKLDKAKETTDLANMRAAKAAAVVQMNEISTETTYFYDANKGTLVESKPTEGYGQSSEVVDGASEAPKGKVLAVTINPTAGTVTLKWE